MQAIDTFSRDSKMSFDFYQMFSAIFFKQELDVIEMTMLQSCLHRACVCEPRSLSVSSTTRPHSRHAASAEPAAS